MVKSKPSGPQKEWFVGCLPGPRGMLWASPWKNLRHHVTLRLCCHCCKSLHQYYLCRSHIYVLCVLSRSVMSDSLWPHGLDSPWNSPGQNTGVGSLSLLQGIFPTQGSNLRLPHCRRILYQLSHQGSPRILEWEAYCFSRWSSWPRNWTGVSCLAGGFFTSGATREARIQQAYTRIKVKQKLSQKHLPWVLFMLSETCF